MESFSGVVSMVGSVDMRTTLRRRDRRRKFSLVFLHLWHLSGGDADGAGGAELLGGGDLGVQGGWGLGGDRFDLAVRRDAEHFGGLADAHGVALAQVAVEVDHELAARVRGRRR